MLSALKELGGRDHSHMDCLVCCVLSHGKEQSVYGVDGNTVSIQQLTEPFNGTKCPSLAGKPKLFFIQACQGDREQRPVFIQTDGPAHSRSRSGSLVQRDAVGIRDSIPADADFLLGMATVSSFASYRDKISGTWYIQTLCRKLVQLVPRLADRQSRSRACNIITGSFQPFFIVTSIFVMWVLFQGHRPHLDHDQSEPRSGPENRLLRREETDAPASLFTYQESGLLNSQRASSRVMMLLKISDFPFEY